MSLINIELIECFSIYVLLFVCFLGALTGVLIIISILLEFTHKIFSISKEYHSYIKYRNDLDYVIYLQEKAEKTNSKVLLRKADKLSKEIKKGD